MYPQSLHTHSPCQYFESTSVFCSLVLRFPKTSKLVELVLVTGTETLVRTVKAWEVDNRETTATRNETRKDFMVVVMCSKAVQLCNKLFGQRCALDFALLSGRRVTSQSGTRSFVNSIGLHPFIGSYLMVTHPCRQRGKMITPLASFLRGSADSSDPKITDRYLPR